MTKTLPNLELALMLFVLGTAWFLFMEWVWPRHLAATILVYSAGALVVFIWRRQLPSPRRVRGPGAGRTAAPRSL